MQSLAPAKDQPAIVPGISYDAKSSPLAEPKPEDLREDPKYYAKLIKREVCEGAIKEPGKVVYLEESTNLSLLVNDYNGAGGVVHYPMHGNSEIGCSVSARMDKLEIQMLHQRGALSLPPRSVADDLVKVYFKWVAPVMPIINKTRFMQQYRNPNNPPSLLLQQAVFLAASRACNNAELMDSSGSTIPAATTFYRRAKALYETGYEDDRIAIVQALILMGWYWEDPGKVTKNVFYWNGLAVTIAHGCGMHRNAEESRLSKTDKRLWKRIWWTLFTRDRSVAVALGRPPHIHMDDSDVEVLTESDFIEDEDIRSADSLPGRLQVQFFLQYVKLCEVMDLVLLQNYSLASKTRRKNALGLTECDMALADWLQNCPHELRWEQSRHHFWSALLFTVYHTTSCLLHRTHLPAAPRRRELQHGKRSDSPIVSFRNPSFQAANAITTIMETLSDHNELRFTPPFLYVSYSLHKTTLKIYRVYSLSSALLIHVYQLNMAKPTIDAVTQKQVQICIACLERISKVWLVARMIQNLYEFILTEKGFGDCLQDGPRKIHDRSEPLIQKSHEGARHKKNSMMKDSSEKSSKPLESQLTPSLLAHMFAALKSGISSSPESSDSLKDNFEVNDDNCYKQPPHLTGVTGGDLYNSYLVFDTQTALPVTQPFKAIPKSEQLAADSLVKLHLAQDIPQLTPVDHTSGMHTESQTVISGGFALQDLQSPPVRDYMQNVVDTSQYFPNENRELHLSHLDNEAAYYTTGPYYASINTPIDQPPANTGPNVLDWSVYFFLRPCTFEIA